MKVYVFDLKAILSVTTGRLLTTMADVKWLVSHMAGRSVCSEEMADLEPYRQALLSRYPELGRPDITRLETLFEEVTGNDSEREVAIARWIAECITSGMAGTYEVEGGVVT